MIKHLLILLLLLAGCGEPPYVPPPPERGSIINYWSRVGGDGVPFKAITMHDGPEILIIGFYKQDTYTLMIRYPDEKEYKIVHAGDLTPQERKAIEYE